MSAAAQSLSSEDREVLRDSVRGVLARHWPADGAETRALQPQAVAGIWSALCEQGLGSLGADPQTGGWREVVLVMQELGSATCPAPMLEAALMNHALQAATADDAGTQAWLAGVQAGVIRPAIAWGSAGGDPGAGTLSCAGGELSGSVRYVESTAGATHLCAPLADPGALAIVPIDAPGVVVRALPGMHVPALAELQFDRVPVRQLPVDAGRLADLAHYARLAVLARALGAASRGFELVVDYAKTRTQFGQPIGRFQAIAHKLADCRVSLEATGLLIANAADRGDAGDPDWRALAAAARAFGSTALRQVALETQHSFGAVGFSEEHEAPRHFRRVHADAAVLGGVRTARETLAERLLGPDARSMPELDLGAAANEFRGEVRRWLAEHWSAERRAQHRLRSFQQRDVDVEFTRQLGRHGWIAVSWPTQFGGQDRGPLEQYAYVEELTHAGAPCGAHTVSSELIGPALIAFGTERQREEFLPAFQRGERMFSLGYSEAGAGSDLASLRFSAVRDGDAWILNGEKLWTTRGDVAEYHWLAARTDAQASPPHAGISMFMVALATPGITIRPSMAMYGHSFAAVHYENVRVSDQARVGPVNGGWKVITHALAAERVLMGASVAAIRGLFDELLAYIREANVDGRALRDDAVVRDRIATLAAEIEAARQLAVNGVRIVAQGRVPIYEAAMSKVYSGELMQRVTETAIDLLGAGATLGEESGTAPLDGRIEQMLRRSIMMVVGGGTAQIQRNLIAQRGLGLPR